MTREEAIERLNIHKSTNVFVDSIAEAIDMAIEALSVANLKEEFESADAVSRKAKCCPIAETCMSIDCPVSSEYIGRPSADAVPQSEQYKKGFEDAKRAYEIELARSADAVHTCNTCADKTLCIMSAPDGNWRACKDYKSAVPNCQKCAIKQLWEETEKEDLVEVVRCKDCRHYGIGNCYMYGGQMNEADFCSYGEKRK